MDGIEIQRRKANISQSELAQRVGVSQANILNEQEGQMKMKIYKVTHPPQKTGYESFIFGICPKCGGRLGFGLGSQIAPNFNGGPLYRCWDCGLEYSVQAVEENPKGIGTL